MSVHMLLFFEPNDRVSFIADRIRVAEPLHVALNQKPTKCISAIILSATKCVSSGNWKYSKQIIRNYMINQDQCNNSYQFYMSFVYT